MSQHTYRTYYDAKFAREAMDRPTHWLIVPDERHGYRLVRVLR